MVCDGDMDHLNLPTDLAAVIRRFMQGPLSGTDLSDMRKSLLECTQASLGTTWNLSRSHISRLEAMDAPPVRDCDAYLGLTLRKMLQGYDPVKTPPANSQA